MKEIKKLLHASIDKYLQQHKKGDRDITEYFETFRCELIMLISTKDPSCIRKLWLDKELRVYLEKFTNQELESYKDICDFLVNRTLDSIRKQNESDSLIDEIIEQCAPVGVHNKIKEYEKMKGECKMQEETKNNEEVKTEDTGKDIKVVFKISEEELLKTEKVAKAAADIEDAVSDAEYNFAKSVTNENEDLGNKEQHTKCEETKSQESTKEKAKSVFNEKINKLVNKGSDTAKKGFEFIIDNMGGPINNIVGKITETKPEKSEEPFQSLPVFASSEYSYFGRLIKGCI